MQRPFWCLRCWPNISLQFIGFHYHVLFYVSALSHPLSPLDLAYVVSLFSSLTSRFLTSALDSHKVRVALSFHPPFSTSPSYCLLVTYLRFHRLEARVRKRVVGTTIDFLLAQITHEREDVMNCQETRWVTWHRDHDRYLDFRTLSPHRTVAHLVLVYAHCIITGLRQASRPHVGILVWCYPLRGWQPASYEHIVRVLNARRISKANGRSLAQDPLAMSTKARSSNVTSLWEWYDTDWP